VIITKVDLAMMKANGSHNCYFEITGE